MMIRRIKKAKEMMALKNNRAQAILNEKNSVFSLNKMIIYN